jgi:hypothetical protein
MAINTNITSSWNPSFSGLPFNFSDTYKKGINLGMFAPPSSGPPSPSSLGSAQDDDVSFVANLTKQGFTNDQVNNLFNARLLNRIMPSMTPEQQLENTRQTLQMQADLEEKQAERRQKFGEESIRKGLLYQSLANIGPTIAQAMNPGYLLEGANRIAATANEAFRSVPSMNVQSPGYTTSQFKYF